MEMLRESGFWGNLSVFQKHLAVFASLGGESTETIAGANPLEQLVVKKQWPRQLRGS